MTCSYPYQCPKLVIGSYAFPIRSEDIEITPQDKPPIVATTPNGVAITKTLSNRIITFNLTPYVSNTGVVNLDPVVYNAINAIKTNQFNAIFNNLVPSYLSFTGYGISFNNGIIISVMPIGGYVLKQGTTETHIYDAIKVAINTGKIEWV